jgi:hypothetical protein
VSVLSRSAPSSLDQITWKESIFSSSVPLETSLLLDKSSSASKISYINTKDFNSIISLITICARRQQHSFLSSRKLLGRNVWIAQPQRRLNLPVVIEIEHSDANSENDNLYDVARKRICLAFVAQGSPLHAVRRTAHTWPASTTMHRLGSHCFAA